MSKLNFLQKQNVENQQSFNRLDKCKTEIIKIYHTYHFSGQYTVVDH